jgi:predicted MFS family arabinose efflux permease
MSGAIPASSQHARMTVPLAIALLSSAVIVAGTNLMYPLLPLIAADLGVEESRIGLVIAAYTAPAVVLAPLFGLVADLYGRRWLLIGGLTLFAVAGLAAALTPTFDQLLLARVVQGIGMSALSPLTIVLLTDLAKDREQELDAQGKKVAIDRVAIIAFPLVGGALALISWRAALLCYAAALVAVAVAYLWMPETRAPGKASLGGYLRDMLSALKERRVWLAFAVGFLRFVLDYGYFVYMPLFLGLRYGASVVVMSAMVSISAAGAIVTAVSVRRLSAFASIERLLTIAFLLSAVGLVIVVSQPPLWFVAIGSFLIGLGNGLISPLQKTLITRTAPPALRGGVISCDRMVQQLAKSLSPTLLGLLLLVGPMEAVLSILIVVSAVGVGLMAMAERKRV